ncbi:MAG TPA: hypothetical protein VNT26_12075 [Candidatus Sulfotelmatobacter sp.]|nr:hypothetical protein [Candidatus Sulfotelmatobacter sp.]HWI57636.1 hypothetical protein [Bacillota bacterium]
MASIREYKRRAFLPLIGLGLAAYYLAVFVPLAHRAESLDAPLQKAWRTLAGAVGPTNATAISFQHITNQLQDTRQALATLQNAKKQAAARLQVSTNLQAKLREPFQLVDYENERSKQRDDLARQAKEQQVNLDPAVMTGFPEYTIEVQEPGLLWAALALTHDLLDSAVRSKVSIIHSLEVPLNLTNAPTEDCIKGWAEIPIQVEFTASAGNAARFIQSLPARPEKPPLFIDRFILKKQSPEKVDEVRVWVQALGFVPRE